MEQADPDQRLRFLANLAREKGRYLARGIQSETFWRRLPATALVEAGWTPGSLDGPQATEFDVVVKVPAYARRDIGAQRLAREARILGRLEMHGVAGVPRLWLPCTDAIDDAVALPAIAVTDLPGQQLAEALVDDRRDELRSGELVQVLVEAWSRLRACHGARVIHRDFGAHNVLVRRRPEGSPDTGMVSLLDFGYAFAEGVPLLDDHGRLMASVSRGVAAGHLAPEQQEGWEDDPSRMQIGPYDFESTFDNELPIDIYQWGCSVLHAVLREPPTDLATALASATQRPQRKAAQERARKALLERAQLPQPLEAAVVTALAYHPRDRNPQVIGEALAQMTDSDRLLGLRTAGRDAKREVEGPENPLRELHQAADRPEELEETTARLARLEQELSENERQRLATALGAQVEVDDRLSQQLAATSRAAIDLKATTKGLDRLRKAIAAVVANHQRRRSGTVERSTIEDLQRALKRQESAQRSAGFDRGTTTGVLLLVVALASVAAGVAHVRASSDSRALRTQLAQASAEAKGFQGRLAQASAEAEGLEGRLAQASAEAKGLEGRLARVSSELTEAKNELNEAKTNEGVNALRAKVNVDIRSTCHKGASPTFSDVTVLECMATGGVTILYHDLETAAVMDAAFNERFGAWSTGSCRASGSGYRNTWSIEGATYGTLSCQVRPDGWMIIDWTDDRTNVYGIARLGPATYQDDLSGRTALYNAWSKAAT